MIRQLLYPSKFEPIIAPANPAAPTQWFAPLSEPRKIVTAAAVLIASGCTLPPQVPATPAATPSWGWFTPLSQPLPVRRQFEAGATLPAQVPTAAPAAPSFAWFNPLATPIPVKRQFRTEAGIPPRPPIGAPAYGWYRPLSEPYFQPQSVRARQARITSPVWSFAPPAAPPAAPPMAFFRPLSDPVFAKVKYPVTRWHLIGWSLPEPAAPPVEPGPPYNPGFVDGGRCINQIRGGREMDPQRGGRSLSPTNGGRGFRPTRT